MTEEKKQSFLVGLSLLKTVMQEEELVFGIVVDKKDPNKSQLAALSKHELQKGKMDGTTVSLDELNKGLL